MGISPLEMNGMVGRTLDYSTMKQNDDNKGFITNANMHTQVEQKAEKNVNTVRQGDNTEMKKHPFDAKEKGNGEYYGDGGNQRKEKKKEKTDGKVIQKQMGGFDIKI